MPEEPLRIAQFDHVSDGGDLVFVFDHRHFAVRVDDTLERGILEAKQIRAEEEGFPSPQSSSALPISRIQSYIRAGADPESVARQFNIAQALVRRFSTPVETEKKYAIDQFLTVAVPPNSKAKSYGELIEMTLRNARITMSSITWSATRRGHEPWRIRAQFQSSGRIITADWNWNIRDNTVSPLNRQAKRLIGVPNNQPSHGTSSLEQVLDGRGPLPFAWMENEDETASENLPLQKADLAVTSQATPISHDSHRNGESLADTKTRREAERDELSVHNAFDSDGNSYSGNTSADGESATFNGVYHNDEPDIDFSPRDAEIADVSSSMAYIEGEENSGNDGSGATSQHPGTRSDEQRSDEQQSDEQQSDEHERRHVNKYSSWMYKTTHGKANAASQHSHSGQQRNDQQPVRTADQQGEGADRNTPRSSTIAREPHAAEEDARSQSPQSSTQASHQRTWNTGKATGASKESGQNQDSSKKKSGRSAVPSWDEILFGD
ncbi:MAG: septation protein SepH [Bifidobacterium aquikefiri]|uniref:DUF3071 domain-containing protein n=1 Tax=Bifidobacterium aquikefiri TaxID=1653207 RepID=A0A261G6A7_9BIFI|nr:septation protein SepH [Bifidobacterium aquikefiri]OZG66743.1 hypothetical protein BAQU_0815 [Bifidobacterium aquikefiri]